MNPLARAGRLASLERLKIVVFNLILFMILVPNARLFQEFLEFLGYPSVTVPVGAALAGLYVLLSLLAKAFVPSFPTIPIQTLSNPERILFLTLLYIIGSVLLLHAVFRPISLPLDNDTARTFVRLLVGPLTCLLFVGRWHRVRPWPFLMILGTTSVLLILETVASETSLTISNTVRLFMMGSKTISITEGLRFRNQLFFGLYAEPSHAFLSLLLCIGGLLLCWRRSLIRPRTLLFGMAVFLTALSVGVSRTAYLSLAFGLSLALLLGITRLTRPGTGDQLPSRLRRYLPALTGPATVALTAGCAVLALFLTIAAVTHNVRTTVDRTDQSGALLSGRRHVAFETLNILLTEGLANLETLDALSSGRFTQAWVGYSQPVISPLGSKAGTASTYLWSLHFAPPYETFEYNRLHSTVMNITYMGKRPETDNEFLLEQHRRKIYSIRSYGALLSYYNGVFGWLAILLLVGGVLLHPLCLRVVRAESLLVTAATTAFLTVVTFSIPTLPGAWPLIALPGYLAKVHNAGTEALEAPLQQGGRRHAPPQVPIPANLHSPPQPAPRATA